MTDTMTGDELQAHEARSMKEKRWLAQVREMAEGFGWWVCHHYDSRRTTPGWPDLMLIRPPRLILAELKRHGEKATEPQARVLYLLGQCKGVEAYLWRPLDADRVEAVLR